jgi:hypothetical protein
MDDVTTLWARLETARKKLPESAGAEKTYAAIYQQIVRLGGAQQLRRSYR